MNFEEATTHVIEAINPEHNDPIVMPVGNLCRKLAKPSSGNSMTIRSTVCRKGA